uniref:Uncharacterized protein n=1 Tax=Arundo donax TaxID=35708 RepID=A0A0A9AV26_ARUDO
MNFHSVGEEERCTCVTCVFGWISTKGESGRC